MRQSVNDPQALRRTPLYAEHVRLGARMIPFVGWEMPLQYRGIIEEHQAVRQGAGLFDVSHMGRLEVKGPEAASFLRSLMTYDIARLAAGEGHYALVCQDDGGILDDVYVFRPAEERFLVVVNSVNAEKISDWARGHLSPSLRATVEDRQGETVMLALQGPEAQGHMARIVPPLASLRRHHCAEVSLAGATTFFSRTGYTGEDGFEIILPVGPASPPLARLIGVDAEPLGVHGGLWRFLVEQGVQPCGLGARDTLRLEAALPLYGNDIDESTNPFEAGLAWVVSFDDGADFVGRRALLAIREIGVQRQLACLKALERGVMRAGYPILHDGRRVSHLTSGSFSPTLGVSIGLAYLPTELATAGTELEVDVRGRALRVQVVPRPFYKRRKA